MTPAENDKPPNPAPIPARASGLRRAAWLAAMILALYGLHVLFTRIVDVGALLPEGVGEWMFGAAMLGALGLYALLLAVPFMPGVEIGISLLLMHGASAAPFVYLATLSGLMIAYAFGVAFAHNLSCRFLGVMGFARACAFVERLKAEDEPGRVRLMEQALPPWARRWLLERRYLLLALALNLPGNALIGGGGGIMMLAGLTGLFATRWLILTIVLAVAPVPVAVWLYGPGFLG